VSERSRAEKDVEETRRKNETREKEKRTHINHLACSFADFGLELGQVRWGVVGRVGLAAY
jgi:hypothetical protein